MSSLPRLIIKCSCSRLSLFSNSVFPNNNMLFTVCTVILNCNIFNLSLTRQCRVIIFTTECMWQIKCASGSGSSSRHPSGPQASELHARFGLTSHSIHPPSTTLRCYGWTSSQRACRNYSFPLLVVLLPDRRSLMSHRHMHMHSAPLVTECSQTVVPFIQIRNLKHPGVL